MLLLTLLTINTLVDNPVDIVNNSPRECIEVRQTLKSYQHIGKYSDEYIYKVFMRCVRTMSKED